MRRLKLKAGEFSADAEFDRELRVVMEKRRWRTDDLALALLHEALYATAFAAINVQDAAR